MSCPRGWPTVVLMLSRRSQIARLRRVALAALERYPLPEGRLRFVTHGENTTFRHDSSAGSHLVRVHRPQRHGRHADGDAAIRSEIAWLDAIRTDTDLAVPEALTATDGAVTVQASAAGETRTCSVLRWMDGRIFEDSARPVHFGRLGEAMARLHLQADGWTPPPGFTRIDWNHQAFFGNVMVYGDVPAGDCWQLFPDALRSRFEKLANRLEPLLSDTADNGLIHADLHPGNAVFEGDRVKLIDFDDCGTGHRLYELAVAIWERRDADDYRECLAALLAGYRSVRPIEVTQLDDFIALRQFAFQIWYTGTAQVNPAFAGRLAVVERWSMEMLDLLGY